jgi:hypothetical protein
MAIRRIAGEPELPDAEALALAFENELITRNLRGHNLPSLTVTCRIGAGQFGSVKPNLHACVVQTSPSSCRYTPSVIAPTRVQE